MSEQEQSEQIRRDYEFTQIEMQKLRLESGDTLMITVKNDYIDPDNLRELSIQFKKVFPNNQVFVFNVGTDGDIKFAVVSQPQVGHTTGETLIEGNK